MQDAILSALQPYGLKQAGRSRYRCNSPLRPGSNSHAFAVTIDPEAPGGGVWFDHVADTGGDFLDLAPLLNIPIPKDVAPKAPTKDPAYAGLGDYAQAHGVPAATFAAAGWCEGMHFCSMHGRKRRALLFQTRTGERARFIDGDKPKYVSPKGYTACMYGLDRAVALAEQTGQPLVLANGEASTVAAQHFGVAATCQTAGEKRLSDANLAALQAAYPTGAILLPPDCDPTGRKTAADLHEQLTAVGYSVRVVDLSGAPGFDLANFATLHQEGTAAALLALPDLPPPQADASVYVHEMERLRQELEQTREQLAIFKADHHRTRVIVANPILGDREKVGLIALTDVIDVRLQLANAQRPTASVHISGAQAGHAIGQRSDSTGRRVINALGEHGVLAVDKVRTELPDGTSVDMFHIAPGPAYTDLTRIVPIVPTSTNNTHGGKRKDAGRKPKCAKCPDGTVHTKTTRRIIGYYCPNHGLLYEEELPTLIKDYRPDDEAEIKLDCRGDPTVEHEAACRSDDTLRLNSLSVTSAVSPDEQTPSPAIPPHIEEAVDLTTAIRAADRYSPPDELGRFAFKRALKLLHKHDADGAVAQLPGIEDPQAHAIVEHLAARHAGQAAPA